MKQVVLTDVLQWVPTAKLIHTAKGTKPKYQLVISPNTTNFLAIVFNVLSTFFYNKKTLTYNIQLQDKFALGIQKSIVCARKS